MTESVRSSGLRHRWLDKLRWMVPVSLSLAGLAYVLGESFIAHGHEPTAGHRLGVLVGLMLLGVVGPVVTYLAFNWALQITERVQTAEASLQNRNRQLETINQIGSVVNQTLDIDRIVGQALGRLLDLLQMESGAIWLRHNGNLELRAARGVSDRFLEEERIQPLGNCLCGRAAELSVGLTLEEIVCDQDFLEPRCQCEQFASAFGVPIRSGDQVVGVLEVASAEVRAFDPGERQLLLTIGAQIGLAVERARLHHHIQAMNQELEALVQARTRELLATQDELAAKAQTLHDLLIRLRAVEESTRARIAGDLHDGVQQLLVGALFETVALGEALERDPQGVPLRLATLQEVLRRLETEMRVAIYSLRPPALDNQGLVGALQACVEDFRRAGQMVCRLKVDGRPRRFRQEAELAAFRIAQEALNNAAAHSAADQVTLSVEFGPDDLRLEVADNGRGFDPLDRNGDRGHLGLLSMQERAQSAGGTFSTWSGNGFGTRIVLTLPLEQEPT